MLPANPGRSALSAGSLGTRGSLGPSGSVMDPCSIRPANARNNHGGTPLHKAAKPDERLSGPGVLDHATLQIHGSGCTIRVGPGQSRRRLPSSCRVETWDRSSQDEAGPPQRSHAAFTLQNEDRTGFPFRQRLRKSRIGDDEFPCLPREFPPPGFRRRRRLDAMAARASASGDDRLGRKQPPRGPGGRRQAG